MNSETVNMDYDSENLHVVFGATGAYGYAIVRKLLERGRKVRAVVRNESKALKLFPKNVEIVRADVLDEEQTVKACNNVSVMYVCNNFPYKDWADNFTNAIVNILKGAHGWNPIVVFPGNVYGYGKFLYNSVDESHPLNAKTKKGVLRNEIESLILEYHHKGKIKAVIPRFADFYGPNVTNDLYGAMFKNAIKGKPSIWPLNIDTPHNFTYIDDAAEATMLLVEDPSSFGKVFHVSGEVTSAHKFIDEIYHALNTPSKIRVLSRALIRMLSPFNSNIREIIELLYEYESPYNIDDSRFMDRYPSFRHTPYDTGIKNTIEWFRKNTYS